MLYNSIRRQKTREFDHWKRLLVLQHVNRVIRLKVETNGYQKREILIIHHRIYSKNKIFKCIAPVRKSVSFLLKNSREWSNSSLTAFFSYSIHDIPQSPVLLILHQLFNTGKSSERQLQPYFFLFYRFLGRQLVSFLVPSCQGTARKKWSYQFVKLPVPKILQTFIYNSHQEDYRVTTDRKRNKKTSNSQEFMSL